MCPLFVVFLSAFLAGVLAGGAVTISAVMFAVNPSAASVAVVWGGGAVGALAVIATFMAWRITSTLCRATERRG
jgi:threonine dehydrogenase-like Zn-dependent dehydrogenase